MESHIRDSSGRDNHGKAINPEHLRKGLAPILGEGASIHLDGESYIELVALNKIGSTLQKGFYLGIDTQPETDEDLALCGAGENSKTSLRIFLRSVSKGAYALHVDLRDDDGKSLSAFAELSAWPAKRLFISVFPPKSEVSFSEVTLHEDNPTLETTYTSRQNPANFSDFGHPFIFGGFNSDGVKQGRFVGRIANIFLIKDKPISDEHLQSLIIASREDLTRVFGIRPKLAESRERREIFKDDLLKLKKWNSNAQLSDSDMKDASVVLFKWVSDRKPLLQDLSDELGIQLSFPGESDRGRNYTSVIQKHNPVYAQSIHLGTRSVFGFKWVPRNQFLDDMAFITQGHQVSHGAFLSFVRNKLGGGHFDDVDRKKWQKELAALPVSIGNDRAINFHMKEILRSVLEAVEGCRIESQLRT